MKKFIGVKLVMAVAMTRMSYVTSRGWDLPENEDGDDEGYEVEYLEGGKPNIEGRKGYVSWCPKEQFEKFNRPTEGMSFGMAVEAMKKGLRVARAGWNGSGMFAYIVPANSYPAQTGAAKAHFGESGMVPYREYMALKTAQDDVATWAPSGSDALADDWVIVE